MNAVNLEATSVDLALPSFGQIGVAGSVCDAMITYIGKTLNIKSSIAAHVPVEVTAID